MELSQPLARLKSINREIWYVVDHALAEKNDKLLLQALAEVHETSSFSQSNHEQQMRH